MTSSSDHSLKVWRVDSPEPLATLAGNTAPVSSLAIRPDGLVLASGARDNTIKLWDLPQTKPVRILARHDGAATAFAFDSAATRFLSVGHDKRLLLVGSDPERPPTVLTGHASEVVAAAYRADGHQVATADAEGTLRLWRTIDGHPEAVLPIHHGAVSSLSYHANNQQLISTGADGLVKVWQLPISPVEEIAGGSGAAKLAALSSDGELVATSDGNQPTVVVRHVSDGRVLATLKGHAGPITAMAFNAGHTRLVTGSADKSIRVWDLSNDTFAELAQYTEHGAAIGAVAFIDAASVVSAAERELHQWTMADGMPIRKLAAPSNNVLDVAVAGNLIAAATAGGAIQIYDKGTGEVAHTIQQPSPVARIAFSADGKRLASWGVKQPLTLWQMQDGDWSPQVIGEGVAELTDLEFSPNGQQLAATVGGDVRTWQLDGGAALQRFPGLQQSALAVEYLADAKTLVWVDGQGRVRRAAVSALRSTIAASGAGIVDAVGYQGGNLLATVTGEGVVRAWTTGNGQLAREFAVENVSLISVNASANGQYLAAGAQEGRVLVWNAGNGTLMADIATPAAATAIALSNESAMKLAVAGADRQLRVFATADGTLLQQTAVDSPPRQVSFLPDNERMAVAHESGVVAEYAFASPTVKRNMTGHSGGVFGLAFTSDGKTLVSASSDRTVRLWDTEAGRQIRTLSGHSGAVFGVALSADSSWIVSAGGDATIRLWDRISGRQLKQIDAPGALYTVAMHADGKTVAAAGIDRAVYLYDVFGGTLKATLEGHPDYVYRVIFNHAGNRLLSCGYGGHLMVWDFPSGKLRHRTRARGVLNSVAYSPDDSQIVVASDNGTAQLFALPANAR